MRAPAAAALLALVAKMFVFADGLAVGTDHACVLLDDASVRYGERRFTMLLRLCVSHGLPSHVRRHTWCFFGLSESTSAVVSRNPNPGCRCFGLNEFGQLGQGDTAARGQSAATMGDNLGAVDLGAGAVVVDMAAGSDHTCVVLGRGDVKVGSWKFFGQDTKYNLGKPPPTIAPLVCFRKTKIHPVLQSFSQSAATHMPIGTIKRSLPAPAHNLQ